MKIVQTYIANDGTPFSNKEQCLRYEENKHTINKLRDAYKDFIDGDGEGCLFFETKEFWDIFKEYAKFVESEQIKILSREILRLTDVLKCEWEAPFNKVREFVNEKLPADAMREFWTIWEKTKST
ncbi:MAG: hypothetical protein WC511_02390 [Candidatus Pacearchaeota archaeon]